MIKPFHSWFCSEGNHTKCKGSLQPIMSGKCECLCHKKPELLKVLATGGNASTWREIVDLPKSDAAQHGRRFNDNANQVGMWVVIGCAAAVIVVATVIWLSGCVVDSWPDPKGDAYWGTTSTPAPRK